MDGRLADLGRLLESGGRVRIAGLGDSLTQGWMVRRSFFDLACDELAHRFPRARIERLDAGVPGDTAEGGLARIDPILSWKPDLVVIAFGLNDAYDEVSPEAFRRDLERIGQAVAGSGGLPMVATECPLPDPRMQAAMEPFWQAVRDLASYRDWPLADLEAHWRRTAGGPGLHLHDGVHPSQAGHAMLARGLVEALLGPG